MKPIGRRNQLATIQTATSTTAGLGQTKAWSTLAREWVLVEPVSASESQQGGQMTGALSTAITMPFRADVSVTDRIVIGSRTLEIQSLQDLTARREELRCLCVEVAA